MQKTAVKWLAVTLLAALVAGCGGGGGDGGGTTTTSSNLKDTLYPTLNTVPVVSSSLIRQQAATPIVGAKVTYVSDKTGIAGFNAARITVASATSDGNGVASFAVPAGTYTAQLSGLTNDAVTGENAAYFATETVAASGGEIYQADQYALIITTSSSKQLSGVQVSIYQTDSSGKVDWGSYTNAVDPMTGIVTSALRNPIVFDKTTALASATSDTENPELFKGYYRIVVRGTPAAATDSLAPYISNVITVTGGSNTVNNTISLDAPSKAPSITLNDTNGAPLSGYVVDFYESTNHILLGSATTDTNGVASVGAPSGVTGVVAKIYSSAGVYQAVYVFNNINTTSAAILQQFTVAGQLQPSSGTLSATTVPTVYALANSGLGRWADTVVESVAASADGYGTYTLTLFGGGGTTAALNYKLAASNVTGFPDVTKKDVAVNAGLQSQNIAVAPGGVILGRLQTEGKADLANITVSVYGTASDGIIELVNSQPTDATGNYSLQVPYGTYFVLVNGAVTDGLTVSAASPTVSKNLTQFSLTGQVSKSSGTTTTGTSGATVFAGFQTATTSNLGVYTINVMEGKNWICAAPSAVNDPTYGYSCNLNVLVDATTVAAARK